jgi:hypothetical protein
MPRIAAINMAEHDAQSWIRRNPCPETGSALRLVRKWEKKAGGTFKTMGLSRNRAHDFIDAAVRATSGRKPYRNEIRDILDWIYGQGPITSAPIDDGLPPIVSRSDFMAQKFPEPTEQQLAELIGDDDDEGDDMDAMNEWIEEVKERWNHERTQGICN